MSGFTMEAVAEQAKASKATVYRHWKSRTALLVDAMDVAFPFSAPPATGRLRHDLVQLLDTQQGRLRDGPYARLLAAFIDAAEREPALAALHFDLTERRRQLGLAVLRSAQARGEIPPEADLEVAVDLLGSPVFYRRLIAHREFPVGYSESIINHVLRGLGVAETDRVPA
jgi:AcrR family transcriptional regulator